MVIRVGIIFKIYIFRDINLILFQACVFDVYYVGYYVFFYKFLCFFYVDVKVGGGDQVVVMKIGEWGVFGI